MAPVLRDTEVAEPTTAVANAASSPAKPQPVAVEIPVTVNGARTVAGSDKREPFSETAQTVLVFSSGAVIRLVAPVGPGQLLFVTNEKSKKEVVCQVLKSKQSGSSGGYVELKFTEPAPDFWGVRFPANSVAPSSVGVTPAVPALPTPSKTPVAAPVPPAVNAQPPKPTIPTSVAKEPATSVVKPAAPAAPASSPTHKVPTLSEFLAPAAHTVDLTATEPSRTIDSKQTAPVGLTDVLSPAKKPLPASPTPAHETKPSPANAAPAITKPNSTPAATSFDLPAEEVKIPSWLEPLARNSAPVESKVTPAKPAESTKEVEASTEVPAWLESRKPSTTPPSPSPSVIDNNTDSLLEAAEASTSLTHTEAPSRRDDAHFTISDDTRTPNFGSSLAIGSDEASATTSSGKGLKIGLVAAAVVLAAAGGGYWYMNQPAKSANSTTRAAVADTTPESIPSSAPSASTASVAAATKPSSTNPVANTIAEPPAVTPQPVTPVPTNPAGATRSSTSNVRPSRVSAPVEVPAPEPVKKPALGDVHLAAPKITRSAASVDNAAAPGLADSGSVSGGDAGALLAARGKQPAAPLPVGGDVKPARLLRSVPPVYPPLARNQRLGGDVMLDALIDVNGSVSSMKVISGPAMLHQAAMDAVKQWKYQPATLNDQPTAMHLTVTVQFRLQ